MFWLNPFIGLLILFDYYLEHCFWIESFSSGGLASAIEDERSCLTDATRKGHPVGDVTYKDGVQ
jgi:hypothetical protein